MKEIDFSKLNESYNKGKTKLRPLQRNLINAKKKANHLLSEIEEINLSLSDESLTDSQKTALKKSLAHKKYKLKDLQEGDLKELNGIITPIKGQVDVYIDSLKKTPDFMRQVNGHVISKCKENITETDKKVESLKKKIESTKSIRQARFMDDTIQTKLAEIDAIKKELLKLQAIDSKKLVGGAAEIETKKARLTSLKDELKDYLNAHKDVIKVTDLSVLDELVDPENPNLSFKNYEKNLKDNLDEKVHDKTVFSRMIKLAKIRNNNLKNENLPVEKVGIFKKFTRLFTNIFKRKEQKEEIEQPALDIKDDANFVDIYKTKIGDDMINQTYKDYKNKVKAKIKSEQEASREDSDTNER